VPGFVTTLYLVSLTAWWPMASWEGVSGHRDCEAKRDKMWMSVAMRPADLRCLSQWGEETVYLMLDGKIIAPTD